MKGLFLGAGSSYECGFPLVDELTLTMKIHVSVDKLRVYNENFKRFGPGWSEKTFQLIEELYNSGMNYENIIGYLESLMRYNIDRDSINEINHVRVFLLHAIGLILFETQIRNFKYSLDVLKAFRGIKNLLLPQKQLWIFSLNHDMLIEMLCNMLDIPIKTGFFDSESFEFGSGVARHIINFECLTEGHIKQNKLNWFRGDDFGVNLLKLHGALDIFAHNEGVDYLKIKFAEKDPTSGIQSLIRLNQINHQNIMNGEGIPNELIVLDKNNDLKLLRNSILSGAHKFLQDSHQVAPKELLSQFDLNIKYLNELICIGYGFGDNHVNDIIRTWLEFSGRKLLIVDPFGRIPVSLAHLTPRITVIKKKATEYFMSLADDVSDEERIIVDKRSNGRDMVRKNYLNQNIRESFVFA